MPRVDELVDYLSAHHPRHGEKVARNLASVAGMKDDLVMFLERYQPFMERGQIGWEQLADAYLTMVNQMTAARLDFMRSGKYPAEDQTQAVQDVYSHEQVMTEYMLGLALSQFLWKHHYQVYSFYRSRIRRIPQVTAALEVGTGHGLFLLDMLTAHPEVRTSDVVDISDISLGLTKSLLQVVAPDAARAIRWVHDDVVRFEPGMSYDFITMGEVLEHVPDPVRVLSRLAHLLTPTGRMFVSTCANCPTIDHIYHFHSVQEIRDTIGRAGFHIEEEDVVPSEDVSAEDLERYRLDILYAAILRA
jgi:2-polyprenyl-3-methyl-5-hydroxy-6-metoxy-1,4-benzoquinol methylase